MKPKWLWRLESTTPDNGLWYDSNNHFVWGLGKARPMSPTKDLPMGYDERYHKDNRDWFSSCSNPKDLVHWFTLEDAEYLMEHGFRFTKWLATEYCEYPLETCFIKETSLKMVVLDYNDIKLLFKR